MFVAEIHGGRAVCDVGAVLCSACRQAVAIVVPLVCDRCRMLQGIQLKNVESNRSRSMLHVQYQMCTIGSIECLVGSTCTKNVLSWCGDAPLFFALQC